MTSDQPRELISGPGLIAMPLALGSAVFVMAFDSTAIPVALPAIAKSLGIEELSTSGLLSAYLIAALCPLPLVAWLCARIGSRQALIAMLGLCAIGSVISAGAQGIGQLLLGRIMLGAGGAMLLPIARLIIARSVAPENLVSAFSKVTIPTIIGPMLAPPIAGLLVAHTSWRMVPLANLVCILFAILAVLRFVPPIAPERQQRIDLTGTALAVLFLLLLGIGLATGVAALPLPYAGVVLLGAAILGLVYRRHAASTGAPVIDLRLMRLPSFRDNTIGIFLARIVPYAGPFLLTMYFQVGLGFPPDVAGGLYIFNALGSTVSQLTLTMIVGRIGSRAYMIATSVLFPVLFSATVLLTPNTTIATICVLMFVQGFLRSGQVVISSALAYSHIPRSRIGQANNILGITQQFACNAGLAAAAAGMGMTAWLTPGTDDAMKQLQVAFVAVCLISLTAVPFLARLPVAADRRT